MLYKTCFHHILPWCPGLQAPLVLLCLNDVLRDCNPASPSPHRHLPAISECGMGHACRTRLSMRKRPIQCLDVGGMGQGERQGWGNRAKTFVNLLPVATLILCSAAGSKRDWRSDSAAGKTCCSCRGPGFSSSTHIVQLSVISVLEDPMPSSFSRQVSSCCSGCPVTHSVDQADFRLRDLPVSAS